MASGKTLTEQLINTQALIDSGALTLGPGAPPIKNTVGLIKSGALTFLSERPVGREELVAGIQETLEPKQAKFVLAALAKL